MDNKNITTSHILGAGAGFATYAATKNLSTAGFRAVFQKFRLKVDDKHLQIIEKAAYDAFEKEGFKAKGYQILDASTPKYDEFMKNVRAGMDKKLADKLTNVKNPIRKIYERYKYNKAVKNFERKCSRIINGTNASYNHFTKPSSIHINMKKGAHMFFHELGHAIDYLDKSKASAITATRHKFFCYTPLILSLTGALSTSKPEKGYLKDENTSGVTKFKQFLKNNCGIIAMFGAIPLVASEASANLHGEKLAVKYLDKNLRHITTKSHMYSILGYLTVPLIAYCSTRAASHIRDIVVNKSSKEN